MLKVQANFSEVFEVLSSNDAGSNYIQIRLPTFSSEHNTVMHVDQPLRVKPLKTAFGSTEKPGKHSKTHRVSFFRLYYIFCRFLWEYCCLIFYSILTPYKLLYHALVTCGRTQFAHALQILLLMLLSPR